MAEIEIAGVRARVWDLQASNGVSLDKVAIKRMWVPTGIPGLWLDPFHQVFYLDPGALTEAIATVALGV